MALNDQFRQYLEAADVDGVRRLWDHVHPHMPAPIKDHDVLAVIHMTRTITNSIPFNLRAWSHRWLVDQGYPSQMPDELKPRAERIYPRIAEAVGIAVVTRNPIMKPVAKKIERAMADAVEDVAADGRISDTAFVTARMNEARDRQRRYFSEILSDPKIKAGAHGEGSR